MAELIEELKKEHSVIIETLKEVEGLGVRTKGGHAKLMFLTMDLLNHLWKEDECLYPVLRKASEHNKKLKEILSFFVNGLGTIHEEILNFITKYSNGTVDSNFQIEYERLFSALRKRIECEEHFLYDEYNMLYH
jgi:iron-sulfur cluster repair protein YtfE (RIC family)